RHSRFQDRAERRNSSIACLCGRTRGYQPELERLAEVVTHRPALNHPALLESPDVDVLGGELPAARGLAKELAELATVHGHACDDLVAFADLVLDLVAHRAPEPSQPAYRLLEVPRSLGIARVPLGL